MDRRTMTGRTIAGLSLAFGLTLPCVAFTGVDTPLPEKYEAASDWVINLHVRTLKDYLNFPKSPLEPITLVEVAYKTRAASGAWSSAVDYELLWFQSGRQIGCRRYGKLALPEDSPGVIRILNSAESSKETRALNIAALRETLDATRIDALPLGIMFPSELCDRAASDLSHFSFVPAKKLMGHAKGLSVRVLSQPLGYDRYYYQNLSSAGAIAE